MILRIHLNLLGNLDLHWRVITLDDQLIILVGVVLTGLALRLKQVLFVPGVAEAFETDLSRGRAEVLAALGVSAHGSILERVLPCQFAQFDFARILFRGILLFFLALWALRCHSLLANDCIVKALHPAIACPVRVLLTVLLLGGVLEW